MDDLIHKWDSAHAQLERLEQRLVDNKVSDRRLLKLQGKIAKLKARVEKLESKVARRREEVLSDLPSTCFFATFR